MPNKNDFIPLPINSRYSKGAESQHERSMREAPIGSDERKTHDLVSSQFDPQRTNLVQDLTRLARDRQYENQVQENFGERHDEKLAGISELLEGKLGDITDRTRQTYQGASNVIGDAYNRAGQATTGASQDVLNALQDQMQRLGLMEAGADPNQMLQQQQTDMSGRHAISGAGAVGNAQALGADMTSLAMKTEGDAAQEWSQKRDALGQQVMATMKEINREYNESRDAVMNELRAVEGARGQATRATLQEVIENRLERERQERLDQLSEWATREGLAIQRGYLDLSGDRFGLEQELGRGGLDIQRGQLGVAQGHLGVAQGSLELQREQLQIQADQWQKQYEMSTSPEAKLEAQLNMQQIEAQIRALDAQTTGSLAGPQGQTQFRGSTGVQNWGDQRYGPGGGRALLDSYLELQAEATGMSAGTQLSPEAAMQELLQNLRTEDPDSYWAMINAHFIINNQHADFGN